MNTTGIFIGLFTVLAIGLGFVWVIKLEYYVGAQVAKAVVALGVTVTLASLVMPNFAASAVTGVLGGTIIWGGAELPVQAKRVARGLFPINQRRRKKK